MLKLWKFLKKRIIKLNGREVKENWQLSVAVIRRKRTSIKTEKLFVLSINTNIKR